MEPVGNFVCEKKSVAVVAVLSQIPKELIDQFVSGPVTAEAIVMAPVLSGRENCFCRASGKIWLAVRMDGGGWM